MREVTLERGAEGGAVLRNRDIERQRETTRERERGNE